MGMWLLRWTWRLMEPAGDREDSFGWGGWDDGIEGRKGRGKLLFQRTCLLSMGVARGGATVPTYLLGERGLRGVGSPRGGGLGFPRLLAASVAIFFCCV